MRNDFSTITTKEPKIQLPSIKESYRVFRHKNSVNINIKPKNELSNASNIASDNEMPNMKNNLILNSKKYILNKSYIDSLIN